MKHGAITKSIFLVLVLCASLMINTEAQEKKKTPEKTEIEAEYLMTVDWENKNLGDAIREIAEKGKVNIIFASYEYADEVIKGKFVVKNLHWKKVLDNVLSLCNMAFVEEEPGLIKVLKIPTVSITAQDSDIREVLTAIAKKANANVIIAEGVSGKVTMQFSNVPWFDALESVVKTAGFSTVREAYNIVRVVKTEALKEQMQTEMIRLKYIRPPQTYIAQIKTAYATGSAKAATDKLKEFTLYQALSSMLTKDPKTQKPLGRLDYDLATNTFIITDVKPVIDSMKRIIEKLDVEIPQVLIDVKVVTTTNEELYKVGVQWLTPEEGEDILFTTAPVPTDKTSKLPFGFGFARDSVGSQRNQWWYTTYALEAQLRLFRKDVNSTVKQQPQLIALDGTEATIFVGEEISYAEIKASSSQAGTLEYTIQEAEKSPVTQGFQLLVIPHINVDENKVRLTVIPQEETLTGTSTDIPGFEKFSIVTGTNNSSNTLTIHLPRKRQSTVVTQMIVESGNTVIVGGLTQDAFSHTIYRVPFFSDIPIIGDLLFRQERKTATTRRMIIYITPYIVRSSTEVKSEIEAQTKYRTNISIEEFEKIKQEVQQEMLQKYLQERAKEQEKEFEELKKNSR